MKKPLAIDLFAGLGGWTEGLLAEGYSVVGFDIEAKPYPAQLVLQDVLTLHGSQFKDAALIVASPPCQNYSYMAMPWKRAKAMAAEIRADETGEKRRKLNALFRACFRIQREASEAAGHHVPMIVENVKGAQKWVGQARWHYGSYYLWGDVPALMPCSNTGRKNNGGSWFNVANNTESGLGQNPDGRKVPGMNFHDYEKTGKPGRSFQSAAADTFGWSKDSALRNNSSHSNARKAASALIAKIPFELAQYIAQAYKPQAIAKI